MLDELIISDVSSLKEYDASVARRVIKPPKKKSIKETVPFSNKTYDFSKINGELYWEESEVQYFLEILADSAEELEDKKTAFSSWVMNVMEEDITDPFITDYHFKGTFENIDFDDDETTYKTTVTVSFLCYPYKIANEPTIYSFTIAAATNIERTIINKSSHRITPTIEASSSIVIAYGGTSYSVGAGKTTDDSFKIETGANTLTISNPGNASCTVSITFYEEVF